MVFVAQTKIPMASTIDCSPKSTVGHKSTSAIRVAELPQTERKILVIGIDAPLLATRKYLLERAGYVVQGCASDHTAMGLLADQSFHMVVMGPSIPPNGHEQLEDRVRNEHPHSLIVKIQRLTRNRGRSPDCFVEDGSPSELLASIALLFDQPAEIVSVIAPTKAKGQSG
jgi:CheY-like chemotaxis protein